MTFNTIAILHYHKLLQKNIAPRLLGLKSLREKKCVVSHVNSSTINGAKYSTFQRAAKTAGLSKSEDFINEMLDDAASMMSLTEDEQQERNLQNKEQINGSTNYM
ncbi:hypothetical protein TNCV_302151 [Trichonephila clavipes]|nr:hypothetical protein TNCV_302151 [Trichonephila clavipes]